MPLKNDRYTYRVTWSEDDSEYVGLCAEFPSLSWLAFTPEAAYPGAAVGILAMRDVANPARNAALDKRKEELENQLRSQFSDYDRAALKALPPLEAYSAYY